MRLLGCGGCLVHCPHSKFMGFTQTPPQSTVQLKIQLVLLEPGVPMNIDLIWDNQTHSRILWCYLPDWTWQDFRVAVAEAVSMVRSVSHRVDVICDFGFTQPPTTGVLLGEWNAAFNYIPPNLGTLVVCNATPFVWSVIKIYIRIVAGVGVQVLTAPDQSTARLLLENRRGSSLANDRPGEQVV